MTKERTMAAARMEVSLFMFFLIVLPLIFAFIVFAAVMTAVIITTHRRRQTRQKELILSEIPSVKAEDPSEEPPQTPEAAPRTFAEILREHRTSRRISQEYVAEQLGVSRQAVSKWENGTSEPSTANLIALSKLYGISLDELVRGTKS